MRRIIGKTTVDIWGHESWRRLYFILSFFLLFPFTASSTNLEIISIKEGKEYVLVNFFFSEISDNDSIVVGNNFFGTTIRDGGSGDSIFLNEIIRDNDNFGSFVIQYDSGYDKNFFTLFGTKHSMSCYIYEVLVRTRSENLFHDVAINKLNSSSFTLMIPKRNKCFFYPYKKYRRRSKFRLGLIIYNKEKGRKEVLYSKG